jgi:hypothetical protein
MGRADVFGVGRCLLQIILGWYLPLATRTRGDLKLIEIWHIYGGDGWLVEIEGYADETWVVGRFVRRIPPPKTQYPEMQEAKPGSRLTSIPLSTG